MNRHSFKILSFVLPIAGIVALALAGCSPQNTLRGVFAKRTTPYEKYEAGLREAKLDQTALGYQWVAAGARALEAPIAVTLPFKETGYFPAEKPMAVGYQFLVRKGQKVAVRVQTKGKEVPQVFLDLYKGNPGHLADLKHVANADTTAPELEYEIEEEFLHILRLQPELLRSGQYTVIIETAPVLAFPVKGKDSRNVQSFWGAPRDAGTRRHEGIDIFAPRLTPVIAAVEGTITKVSTTPIGGKVVWLSDLKRQQNLYYAHLERQLVQPGQRVLVGDTLGLVGNTGNASTTAPHLHFGIYQFGAGAVDPFPYVYEDGAKPAAVKGNMARLGSWNRISKAKATVRQAPDGAAASLATLSRHTPVQVFAGAASWYRVILTNGQQGYIAASVVESLEKPLQTLTLRCQTLLLDASDAQTSAKQILPPDSNVRVLAKQQEFWLVEDMKGTTGWISPETTR